jgi:hypothetical protein
MSSVCIPLYPLNIFIYIKLIIKNPKVHCPLVACPIPHLPSISPQSSAIAPSGAMATRPKTHQVDQFWMLITVLFSSSRLDISTPSYGQKLEFGPNVECGRSHLGIIGLNTNKNIINPENLL